MRTRDRATKAEFQRAKNISLEFDAKVHSSAPTNESGIKGVRARAFDDGVTQELQLQLNGTWYKITLTPVT